MESFWLAETLKYFYLIFTEPPDRCLHASCLGDDPDRGPKTTARLPLTKYVFNTEAHPLPIVGPEHASLVHPVLSLNSRILEPYVSGGGAYPAAWANPGEPQQSHQLAVEDDASSEIDYKGEENVSAEEYGENWSDYGMDETKEAAQRGEGQEDIAVARHVEL